MGCFEWRLNKKKLTTSRWESCSKAGRREVESSSRRQRTPRINGGDHCVQATTVGSAFVGRGERKAFVKFHGSPSPLTENRNSIIEEKPGVEPKQSSATPKGRRDSTFPPQSSPRATCLRRIKIQWKGKRRSELFTDSISLLSASFSYIEIEEEDQDYVTKTLDSNASPSPFRGKLEEGEGVEERRRVHRERTPAKTRSESFSTPGVGVQPTNLGSFRAKLRGWGEKT